MDSSDPAIIFMVTIGLVYEVIAAACSSPQTAEINADRRAATLMKWVHIGLAQAGLFVALEILILARLNRPTWPAWLGAGVALPLMYGQYLYARNAGLRDAHLPGTESA